MPNKSKKSELQEIVFALGCCKSANLNLPLPITKDDVLLLLVALEQYRYSGERSKIPRSSSWVETILPSDLYGDKRFRQNLRMQKNSFGFILDLIKGSDTQENIPIQLCVGLYHLGCFGNASSVGQISDKFGVSEGAVVIFTSRIIHALNTISTDWIQWPDAKERRQIGAQMAHELFPKCVGFVDGSDAVFYQAPVEDKDTYWSRKKKYCMQFQIVCDPSKFIRHLFTGYPGSVHDAKVYSATDLYSNDRKHFSKGEYILGDSAYTNCDTVVVPFKRSKKGLDKQQKQFNLHLSSQRVYVEHTIGILKGRFQSLQGLRLVVDKASGHGKVCEWINACAVLHNILMKIDPWLQLDDAMFIEDGSDEAQHEWHVVTGSAKRDALKQIVNAMVDR